MSLCALVAVQPNWPKSLRQSLRPSQIGSVSLIEARDLGKMVLKGEKREVLRRLRDENNRLHIEREILAKATVRFARRQPQDKKSCPKIQISKVRIQSSF